MTFMFNRTSVPRISGKAALAFAFSIAFSIAFIAWSAWIAIESMADQNEPRQTTQAAR